MNKIIGEFQVTSGELIVTDPCYTIPTRCQGIVKKVSKGKWIAKVVYGEGRVAELIAYKEGYENPPTKLRKLPFEVGVDSGQAGIFDLEFYPKGDTGEYDDKESFYGKCCNATTGDGYKYMERLYRLETEIKETENLSFEVWHRLDNVSIEDFEKYKKSSIAAKQMVIDDLKKNPIEYNQAGIIDNFGVVSSSGWGDGGYYAYGSKDSNKELVYLSIDYGVI